jgi:DNA-binding NarL/FixJ family response regulator
MAGSPYSVLVVDDDFYALEAVQLLLVRDERTRLWGTAESVEDAIGQLAAALVPGPDVVLLDVRFGSDERAGIVGLPAIAAAAPGARVLMTSVLRSEEVVRGAIAAEGRFVMTPSIAEMVLGRVDELREYAAEVLADEPQYADLTSGLKKTLYLFCLCGLSVKEVAAELQVSPNTVSSRIKIAYQVLGTNSRQEAFAKLVGRERNGADHA